MAKGGYTNNKDKDLSFKVFFSFCQKSLDKGGCRNTHDPVFTSNFQ